MYSDQNFESGMGSSVDSLSMNSVTLEGESEGEEPPDTPTGREGGRGTPLGEEGDETIHPDSANIPLMRIVMSKKQTKRPGQKTLKSGWMIHYTDNSSMVGCLY